MGKNIVEKILAKAYGRDEVSAGEYIQIRSNRPVTMGGDGFGRGLPQLRDIGATRVFNPDLIKIVVGHAGAGGSTGTKVGDTRRVMRQWAKEMGIPGENILDLGRQGIEHLVASEKCWPLPGTVYFSVVDGHTATLGALGAFAVALSYESASYIATGSSWVQVPAVAKLVLDGTLPKGVTARDVSEYIVGQLGPTGTAGQVMEWTGPLVEQMSMDARFTLCVNALFTSAWTAIINPDKTTINYAKACTSESFEPIVSDPDTEYASIFQFDVSKLEPQVVPPPERTNVFPLSRFEGTRIDRGFIGSCANGRLDDMRLVSQILKGRQVHPSVQLNITQASVDVYKQCLHEGIIEVFVEAGACIPAPCCGMCAGHNTPLGAGEVCISTGTCNYPGRMGSDKAEIYIGSPATVAASAITGEITDPRNFL